MKLKRPLRGGERGSDVLAVQRALNAWASPAAGIPVTKVYDRATQDRMLGFQLANGISPATGAMGQPTLNLLWAYFDRYGRARYRAYRASDPVPELGPVVAGGVSVLLHDLTHATSGLEGYPGFDDGWAVGRECIAPEPMTVTRHGSAQHGQALYARGRSCEWWFGHITELAPVGARLRRGERFGRVSAEHPRPHVHVGLNTERLLGHELEHHTDYTHGAPTVGRQLRDALTAARHRGGL